MPRLYRVILPVNNLDKAELFYSAILDMPGARGSPERHYFDCDGTILACYDPLMFKEKDEFTPNPEHIYLAVSDLPASYESCVDAGATITAEIQSYPWGETSFYFNDPFGNQICMVKQDTMFTG